MSVATLADVIVGIHVVYVGFVVLAVPLILLGWWRGWRWVHNWWFRHLHLLMIGIVVLESLLAIDCPLTIWEQSLRQAGAQVGYEGSFIGHWLHELLFFDFPPWVFTIIYTLFGATVLLLYVAVPPGAAPLPAIRSKGAVAN